MVARKKGGGHSIYMYSVIPGSEPKKGAIDNGNLQFIYWLYLFGLVIWIDKKKKYYEFLECLHCEMINSVLQIIVHEINNGI